MLLVCVGTVWNIIFGSVLFSASDFEDIIDCLVCICVILIQCGVVKFVEDKISIAFELMCVVWVFDTSLSLPDGFLKCFFFLQRDS